jgi:hypothetical protein
MKTEETSFKGQIRPILKDDLELMKIKKTNSEFVFKNQKDKIKDLKQSQETVVQNKNEISSKEISKIKDEIIMLTLNDKNLWDYTSFDYDFIDGDEVPTFGNKWEIYPYLEKYTSHKGIELRNIALKSGISFNYENCGMEINTNFSLKGESTFWIITRSNIDSPDVYNETNRGDHTCIENEYSPLNKYSSVIKISKEDKSQKCFISLSVFVEDENNKNKIFKTFCKRQLINFSSKYI